jgi:hypothetical protein
MIQADEHQQPGVNTRTGSALGWTVLSPDRYKPLRVLMGVLCFTVVFLIACSPVVAKEIHVLSDTFGAGELSLTSESGIAENQETSNLYVADTENGRIAEYSHAGSPLGTFATVEAPTFITVDNSAGTSAGTVYVVGGNGTFVGKYSPAGVLEAGWGSAGRLEGLGETLKELCVNSTRPGHRSACQFT